MNRLDQRHHGYSNDCGILALRLLALLIGCSLTGLAQDTTAVLPAQPFSVRATHLMGFENAKNNCTGTLSTHNDALQFQRNGKPAVQVEIASVRDIFLGGESKQVGGLPMTLGKAAAPYGGGRVVSVFAHKKYDTLTLEYVDDDQGVHGAIFQLSKGQAEAVKDELVAGGAHLGGAKPAKQDTVEATHESQ